jgi:hypothetical protein
MRSPNPLPSHQDLCRLVGQERRLTAVQLPRRDVTGSLALAPGPGLLHDEPGGGPGGDHLSITDGNPIPRSIFPIYSQNSESALVTDLVSGHIGGVQIYLICAPLGWWPEPGQPRVTWAGCAGDIWVGGWRRPVYPPPARRPGCPGSLGRRPGWRHGQRDHLAASWPAMPSWRVSELMADYP